MSLLADANQQFQATVTGASNSSVQWTIAESGGGAVDSGGLYKAPHGPGTFHVVATSVADRSKTATATVTVASPPAPGSVAISPSAVTLLAGATQQFTAQVNGLAPGVTWSVQEGATGGLVDANGLYRSVQGGTFHVVATSTADPQKKAVATVTVNVHSPEVAGLKATPKRVLLVKGGTKQLAAEAFDNKGVKVTADNVAFTYSSNNPAVVAVNSSPSASGPALGVITAQAAGDAMVTITGASIPSGASATDAVYVSVLEPKVRFLTGGLFEYQLRYNGAVFQLKDGVLSGLKPEDGTGYVAAPIPVPPAGAEWSLDVVAVKGTPMDMGCADLKLTAAIDFSPRWAFEVRPAADCPAAAGLSGFTIGFSCNPPKDCLTAPMPGQFSIKVRQGKLSFW